MDVRTRMECENKRSMVLKLTITKCHQLRKYLTVEPFIFCYFLGYSVFFSASFPAFYNKVCMETLKSAYKCSQLDRDLSEQNTVQTVTTNWLMYMQIARFLPTLVGSMFFGSYGDCYGRKVPLLIAEASFVLYMAFYLVLVTLQRCPVYSLIIVSTIYSMTGHHVTFLTAIFSEIADHTEDKRQLTARYTVLTAFWTLSGLIGGYVSSGLLMVLTYQYVMVIGISVVALTFICSVLSYPNQDRKSYMKSEARCGEFFKSGMSLYVLAVKTALKKRPSNGRLYLALICIISIVYASEDSGMDNLASLFAFHSPLSWDAHLLATWGATNSAAALVGSLIAAYINEKLRLHSLTSVMIGLASESLRMAMIAGSVHTWMMFLVPVLGCASTFGFSAIKAYVVQLGSAQESGELLACITSFMNLFTLYSAIVYNNMYVATLSIYHGFVFAFASVTVFFCLLIVWGMKLVQDRNLRNSTSHSITPST
ncbi:unnamed protein product [Soboliphyme baturini]|uniref:MFS domain-containing protein n=1 Tax=Soboliphyme baturini TaxID=241478 RepID=A0A183IPS0_9BILA|nr:unnamed protein product [Soboliphyme baturini]